MNSKLFSRLSMIACLCAGFTSCIISTGGRDGRRSEGEFHMHGSDDEVEEEEQEQPEEESDSAFEMELAKLEHKRSMLQIQGELESAELAVVMARAELEDAERALENFGPERDLRVGEAQLSLDRSIGNAKDAALELAELQAMYDEETFAEKTKELVLSRGKRSLDESERALAFAKEEMRQMMEVELPAKERELMRNLKSARMDMVGAERDMAVARIAAEIDSMQAEHDLAKARS